MLPLGKQAALILRALSARAPATAAPTLNLPKAGVSQAVFARYLNVSTGVVSKWERGGKHPQGPSLKLLNLVKKKGLQSIA